MDADELARSQSQVWWPSVAATEKDGTTTQK